LGVWGSGLFSDDLDCDVRNEYRDLVAAGATGEEATRLLLESWEDILDDPDASPVFWLALAVTQWKIGRLEESVKAKALEIIEIGADLKRWEGDPSWLKRRIKVLDQARDQINSPQRLPFKLKKTYVNASPFQTGDAFTYQLNSGNLLLFRVVDVHSDRGGTAPVVEICDWIGSKPPSRREIQAIHARPPARSWQGGLLLLFRKKESDFPAHRVQIIGQNFKVERSKRTAVVIFWPALDQMLVDLYGIE